MAVIDEIIGLLKVRLFEPQAAERLVSAFRKVLDASGSLTVEGGDARYSRLGHTHTRTMTIGATFDGSGAALVAGTKCYVKVPVGCTITEASALADVSGSVVVDVWKDTLANYPPTDADSITASAPITIAAATNSNDVTLTGWTTAIAADDVIGFNIDSCSAIKRLHIQLKAGYSA